jgi:outer membrane protein TolC
MRLDQQFRPFLTAARLGALAAFLFASGIPLSVSGQTPAPQTPPGQPVPVGGPPKPAQNTSPIVNGTPLSIDEAVRLALENNLGIQAERLNPAVQDLGISRAVGVYKPALFSTFTRSNATAPPTSFLTSTGVAVTSSANLGSSAGVNQNVKWGGGNYSVSFDGSRGTSNASGNQFNPQLDSNLNFVYNQPLLRNFRIDNFRNQVMQAENVRHVADIQLQQRITQTSRNVRAAYLDLVGAIAGLGVAQQSLELAQQSLKDNRKRLEVGTMAPIDIVASEAEVASNEENVIVAQASIQTAEDQLRALIMNPSQADFWTQSFQPTDQPQLRATAINVDEAITNALANRTDMQQARKNLESTDITLKFTADQKLPAVDLQARYGVTGIGGTQFQYDQNTFPPTVLNSTQRGFGDVLHDVFGNNFRSWSFAVNFSYPLGTSVADAALAQGRLQRQQQVTGIRDLELQIATQVRQAGRNVNTNLKRVEATTKARELAERRLEAEEKRFTVGLSSTFELVQAQRDLARARQNELSATIDYNRSLVDFETVQIAPIGGGR